MSTKEKLQIILITYNRKNYLQCTFNQIFAKSSPIRDFDITVLDNKSYDGTCELIQEYIKNFPNIKHIVHNRNIGGNGNIARAFEIASKEYVWVLCDDDEYDFTHWDKVEEAISQKCDAIVVANYINPQKNIAQLVKQMTFVPSTIYRTENFTDTTMVNMEFCIHTMFPQLAPICYLINNNKIIKILDNCIVNMVHNAGYDSYTRGLDDDKHPYMNQIFWQVGFIDAIQMIRDKKTKNFIIENMDLFGRNIYKNFKTLFRTNKIHFHQSFKNLCDTFAGISFSQKLCFFASYSYFLLDCLLVQFRNLFFFCYKDEKYYRLRIIGIKIKILRKNGSKNHK